MSDDVAIKVSSVSKTFKLPHEKHSSIKSLLINWGSHGFEEQNALENISFEVKKGEFFGIVGKNGGGKSTLLKIISGIYTPTKGRVEINGKLTPFIELGVGFNPELTGRENVFLNGALLGFSRAEMTGMYDEIVKFAELERFMDQKLKNYSSGMQVRLAFSIAIRAKADILIMDEVLAVGDAAFQKKCFDIFRELKKQGQTIVLVTHDMSNVEKFCDRVLVINEGKQCGLVMPSEAASMYARLNINESQMQQSDSENNQPRIGSGEVRVQGVTMSSRGRKTVVFNTGDEFKLTLKLNRTAQFKDHEILIGLAFHNEDDVNVAGPNSLSAHLDPKAGAVAYAIDQVKFAPGEYKLTIVLYNPEDESILDWLDRSLKFSVVSDHSIVGLVELDGRWSDEAVS